MSPLLALHICSGIAGVLSGAAAMCFRKGSVRHRVAGNVFVIAMLSLSISAVYLASLKGQITNILGGVLTFYLVTTAWVTGRRKDGRMGAFDFGAIFFAIAVGSIEMTYGIEAVRSNTGLKYGYPALLYFVFGSVILIAAAADIRMLIRGGIFGTPRIARHLWRMCFALFIATGSFFLGQQQVFPAFIRGSNMLMIPAFLPLLLLVYWMVRVRLKNAYYERVHALWSAR